MPYIHELPQWPSLRWDQNQLAERLAAVRHRQGRLIGRMEGLGFSLRSEATLENLTHEILKSSEIEGEILDREQVRSAIARRLGMDIGGLIAADRHVEGVVETMLDAKARADWQAAFDAWAEREPQRKELFDRLQAGEFPAGWTDALPTYEPAEKGPATRKASGNALAALGPILPELWGGSADLAGSNNTTIPGSESFGPESISTKDWTATPYGRTLHFGVREHATSHEHRFERGEKAVVVGVSRLRRRRRIAPPDFRDQAVTKIVPRVESLLGEHEDRLTALHRETQTALEVVLRTGKMEPGDYIADRYRRDWRPAGERP